MGNPAVLLPRAGASPVFTFFAGERALPLVPVLVVADAVVGRAKLTQGRDGGRHNGARSRADRHAINGTEMAPRERVRRWPEVGDGLATIQHRCPGEILDAVNVQQDPEGDAPLPLVGSVLFDAHLGGEAPRPFVDEGAPKNLGDAVRRSRPNPQTNWMIDHSVFNCVHLARYYSFRDYNSNLHEN